MGDEIKVLKVFLGKICGSSFGEYEGIGNAKEDKITKIVFARENLSCGSNIELSYYNRKLQENMYLLWSWGHV